MYDDHVLGPGLGAARSTYTGKTTYDLPNGSSYPTSMIAGNLMVSNSKQSSDAAFLATIGTYTAAHFRLQ